MRAIASPRTTPAAAPLCTSVEATVAYLFLARDVATLHDQTWRSYLGSCPSGSFTVHIHTQSGKDWPLQTSRVPDNATMRGPMRSNYKMLAAQFALYREALQHTAPNGCRPKWMQLLSEQTVPLRRCADVHHRLAHGRQHSHLEALPYSELMGKGLAQFHRPSRYNPDGPYLWASQWSTLLARDAALLLRREAANLRTWFDPDGDRPLSSEVAARANKWPCISLCISLSISPAFPLHLPCSSS